MITNNIIDIKKTANNIKNVREKNKITINELSSLMHGVSIELIKNIEEGLLVPTLDYVIDYCKLFEKSIDDLIVSKL